MTVHENPPMGDLWAKEYDSTYPPLDAHEPMINYLAGVLPKNGLSLEIGIGTGRIAFPLIDRGFNIAGLDVSAEMIDVLTAKDPDGRLAAAHCASMTDFDLGEDRFDAVFAVFNTVNLALDPRDQAAAFRRAAHHLQPGGTLVVEILNPAQTTLGYNFGRTWQVQEVSNDEVTVITGRLNLTQQTIALKHVLMGPGGIKILPADVRFIWPNEAVLLIENTGLNVDHIYGDWDRSSLTDRSPRLLIEATKPQ
jgi:SAM-dependent methyltransferase